MLSREVILLTLKPSTTKGTKVAKETQIGISFVNLRVLVVEDLRF